MKFSSFVYAFIKCLASYESSSFQVKAFSLRVIFKVALSLKEKQMIVFLGRPFKLVLSVGKPNPLTPCKVWQVLPMILYF